MFALLLSLATGTAARASAPIPCATAEQAVADLHFEGDADEVPADEDGGFPHHHGTGHDHGVGLGASLAQVRSDQAPRARLAPGRQDRTVGAAADPALRPPTA